MKPGVFDGFTEYLQKEKARTIKACPAIVEYMNEGFVIPARTDMHLLNTNGELHVRHAMKNQLQGNEAEFGDLLNQKSTNASVSSSNRGTVS